MGKFNLGGRHNFFIAAPAPVLKLRHGDAGGPGKDSSGGSYQLLSTNAVLSSPAKTAIQLNTRLDALQIDGAAGRNSRSRSLAQGGLVGGRGVNSVGMNQTPLAWNGERHSSMSTPAQPPSISSQSASRKQSHIPIQSQCNSNNIAQARRRRKSFLPEDNYFEKSPQRQINLS